MIIQILPLYLITINAAGFLLMLVDKLKAKRGAWRIPEATLIAVAAAGGSIGSLIGMYLFRHKKPLMIGMLPALIMTYVCSSYIFISPMMFGMENRMLAYLLGGVLTLIIAVAVHFKARRG